MTTLPQTLKNRIYYAARDGMAITLYSALCETPREVAHELLNQSFEEDGQNCTPLIVAARHGHDRVVKMLLEEFGPNMEQEGTIKFDGYVIEGASPLWCAAGAGHLSVVKTLVKMGADINHTTKTKSTPIRAACFDGRLDIVKYLAEHGADIHIANKYNNTCLMIAAYKGHLDVVTYLLESGANPNEKALCGATALHFAAECGHVEIVRELLDNGAKSYKNENGMTPLIAAAERTRAQLVEYFISRQEVTFSQKVEALELLGASFANDKDNYCLELAYFYLKKAMILRHNNPKKGLPKKIGKPVPAYENWIECKTLRELERIETDPNAIHMESLAIRERILGTHNPEVPHPIIFRGAVFADNARFDRCIELWLHALKLRQQNDVSVMKDLLRFAQVFSQMIHVGVELPFWYVKKVLQACVEELSKNKEKLANPSPKDDLEQLMDDYEGNVSTALYMLVIITKLMKNCTEKEEHSVNCSVFQLNKMDLADKEGQTLLHMAVNPETPVDEFHTNDVCKFPCAATAKLLIRFGADVNAMDHHRNTPLHVIVSYQKPISDFLTLHSIIVELAEAGAHMDIVNSQGETPFEAASTGVAEIILRTQSKISLKCMAAKVIKTFKLPYQGCVPQCLESFIELHGTNVKSK